jgi:hypothetical protein
MRMVMTSLLVIGISLSVGGDAAMAGARLADAGQYDAGYAQTASRDCPTLVLRIAPGEDAGTDPEFKRGADMFLRMVKQVGIETACKMALNLYDETTGKVAPLLGKKQ